MRIKLRCPECLANLAAAAPALIVLAAAVGARLLGLS